MTTNSTRSALASSLQDYLDLLEQSKFVAAQSFAAEIADAIEESAAESSALYVVFYYDTDEIIDTVSMLSHYKAKNIKTQEKQPAPRLNDLNITSDEEEMLDRLLKLAAKDVYSLVAAYGKDITTGYIFNLAGTLPGEYDEDAVYNEGDLFYEDDQLYYTLVDETPAGTDPTDEDYFAPVGEHYNTYHKVIYTLNYDAEMDASRISTLNDDIEDAIIKHCLLGWYKAIAEMNMITLSEQEYEDAKYKVMNGVAYRKTPVRRRTETL